MFLGSDQYKRLFRHFLIAPLLMLLTGYSTLSLASDNRLTVTGSSTVAPMILEISKRFERLHPGVRIDVQTGGSSRGINDTRTGIADLGMVSRALKSTEADLTAYLIATDTIGIIVHRSNPISTLSHQQIRAIYTGATTNWRQLGGDNRPITVVNKAEGRSTLELFLANFELKNSLIKASVVIGDNQQGIKIVAGNPGAIAYVSTGTATYEEAAGTPIKQAAISNHINPLTPVTSQPYLISRQLNLVVKNQPSGLAQQFIEFAQSESVHDLIAGQFFTPVPRNNLANEAR